MTGCATTSPGRGDHRCFASELVVIDKSPIGVVSDAMPLLRKVDGVLVVSQLGKNTRDAAAFLRKRLVGVNAPLPGVIANGVKVKG